MGRAAALPVLLVLLVLLLVGPSVVQAQQPQQLPPGLDPGAIQERALRQLEREQRRRDAEREEREPLKGEMPEGVELPESEVTFTLEDIEHGESIFIAERRLRAIVEEYIGRAVTFDDINEMVARINAIYQEQQVITAVAYVPPQTIEDDILYIELLEGKLGALRIEGVEYTREGFLRERLPLTEGEVIDVIGLRRSINTLNRSTALDVQASLEAGAETGESNVAVVVREPPRYSASVFIDNHGSTGTGEWRGGVTGVMNSPLGRADRLTMHGLYAQGSQTGLLRYDVPVNRHGGMLDLLASVGRLEIIDGPFGDAGIEGDSSQWALGYRQALLRGAASSAAASGRLRRSTSLTEFEGEPITDITTDEAELRVDGSWLGQRSRLAWGQAASYAQVELLGGDQDEFSRLPGNLTYTWGLTQRSTVEVDLDWQWTPDEDLPSSLSYQLGGAATVRGYDEGVVAGDRGLRSSLTGYYSWAAGLTQLVFADYGRADLGDAQTTELYSVGTGMTYRVLANAQIEASAGFPLRDVTPDQDSYRLHVRLSVNFPR